VACMVLMDCRKGRLPEDMIRDIQAAEVVDIHQAESEDSLELDILQALHQELLQVDSQQQCWVVVDNSFQVLVDNCQVRWLVDSQLEQVDSLLVEWWGSLEHLDEMVDIDPVSTTHTVILSINILQSRFHNNLSNI